MVSSKYPIWYPDHFQIRALTLDFSRCHVQSEAHVRQMLLIGEDPKKHIKQFSNEFLKNFIDLLKTSALSPI